MEQTRQHFYELSLEYVCKLQEIQQRKKFEFVEPVSIAAGGSASRILWQDPDAFHSGFHVRFLEAAVHTYETPCHTGRG